MVDDAPSQIPAFSRRTFFFFGAAATGVLLTAYQGLRQVGFYPEPTQHFEILTPKEAEVYRYLGEYLIPPNDFLPGSGGDAETLRRLDILIRQVPDYKRPLIRALPHVFEHGTTLDRFGARSMTHLPKQRGQEFLDHWAAGPSAVQAQLWVGLKTIFGMTYFERPEVMEAMGFNPWCGDYDR